LDNIQTPASIRSEFIVTDQPLIPVVEETIPDSEIEDKQRKGLSDLPWWLFAIFLIAIGTGIIIFTNDNYSEAFGFIKAGIQLTITTSLFAYLARLYVELIRGIPMLVLIFFIALVGVPTAIDGMNNLGRWLSGRGLEGIGNILLLLDNQNISQHVRAIVALAVTYGAFLAEIFRAGIQSIGRGQMEASRSLGMNYAQAMRYIILPQAVRNVLPALGNDFVAMVKDSSLISLLGVRDITQLAKVYSGRTFRFREAYITLSVLYLTMTVSLSLLIQVVERRLRKNE
jgi:polar amino acid transport system permease protein